MLNNRILRQVQLLLAGTLLLQGYACYRLFRSPFASGILWISKRWLVIFGIAGLLTLGLAILLMLSFTSARQKVFEGYNWLENRLVRLGKWNWFIFFALFGLFSVVVLSPTGQYVNNQYVRIHLFWLSILVGAFLLQAVGWQQSWLVRLATAALVGGLIYRVAAYLPEITNYPLSLGWSEASRYYYASLYFAPQIYGQQAPLTVLHPSRYLMQAVPFLISNAPIWLHRFWQVFLWIVVTLATAWLVARRVTPARSWLRWIVTAWSFLFLLMGPVYYHLSMIILLVVWGFDRNKLWRTTAIVLVASVWAGISRINWFPMPAMLAATLYILEKPAGTRPIWKYLAPIAGWGLFGTLAAFGAQTAYSRLSGNPPEQFASSFSSDLLWYRLLPNPTYPTGILLSAAIVILPLLGVIYLRARQSPARLHWIRWVSLAGMLLILLIGGLVVSVKIGGGSNLHNLDALLSLLMVVSLYFLFNYAAPEPPITNETLNKPSSEFIFSNQIQQILLGICILIPLLSALAYGGPISIVDDQTLSQSMDRLQRFIQEAQSEPGEILFITERQLLTFKTIEGVKLVPDYEKVFLMEMAMAGNPAYLDQFKQDLVNRRFSMIVTEPLFINYKGSATAFGEENDAWVKHVAEPVLCTYKTHKFLRDIRVQLLIPREYPDSCQ